MVVRDDPRVAAQIGPGLLDGRAVEFLTALLDSAPGAFADTRVDAMLDWVEDLSTDEVPALSAMVFDLGHDPGLRVRVSYDGDNGWGMVGVVRWCPQLGCWLAAACSERDVDPAEWRRQGDSPLEAAFKVMRRLDRLADQVERAVSQTGRWGAWPDAAQAGAAGNAACTARPDSGDDPRKGRS